MDRLILKRKMIGCLASLTIALLLVLNPLSGSVHIWANTAGEDMENTLLEDAPGPDNIENSASSGDEGSSASSGDEGSSANSGDEGSSASSGDEGSSASSDDDGSSASSGDDGSSASSGDDDNSGDNDDKDGEIDVLNIDSADDDELNSSGSLALISVPNLWFGEIKLGEFTETIQASITDSVTVSDTFGAGWVLSMRYDDYANKLPGRLFFWHGDIEKDITDISQVIYIHPSGDLDDEEFTFTKTWNNVDEGFSLEVGYDDIKGYDPDSMILARLVWEITPIVV